MQPLYIKNDDERKVVTEKLARVVYAETLGSSLLAAEALCSMIANLHLKTARLLPDIATDKSIFESLAEDSARHASLDADAGRRDFQMCLRTVRRMMNGLLNDSVMGATKFHRAENLPQWAVNAGYIAEIGGMLFYL